MGPTYDPLYGTGYGVGGIIRPPLPPDPMPRLDAQLGRIENLEQLLSLTQSQLLREITDRQGLEARVSELENLVKELAKSQLGLDSV